MPRVAECKIGTEKKKRKKKERKKKGFLFVIDNYQVDRASTC
jgi:hypothetical protein